jgi:hypothetical protein
MVSKTNFLSMAIFKAKRYHNILPAGYITCLALSLCLFTTPALSSNFDLEMQDVVNSFYNIYMSVRPSGVPTDRELQTFKPYLSASLLGLLKEARRAEEQYAKKTQGEAPPLLEGDLLTSLFEGATEFRILTCDASTDSCLVSFSYVEETRDSSPTTWRDKVYMVKGSQGWLVDDIEFLGDWEFMHKGHLKELLKEVIQEGNDD